jgi:hypothetical protein
VYARKGKNQFLNQASRWYEENEEYEENPSQRLIKVGRHTR